MNKRYFVFLLATIFFLSLICATFTLKQESIQTEYGPGDSLQGWLEMKFNSQSGNSLLTDNFGNSISLKELIIKNSATDLCDFQNCKSKYNPINSATIKTFNLAENESKIIGIKLTGPKIIAIESFKINITSNAGKSCANQIEVDFFDDEKIDLINTNASNDLCELTKTYGCFIAQENPLTIFLTDTGYCQRIKLGKAPGFKLGAWIEKIGVSDTTSIELTIFNDSSSLTQLAKCDITEINAKGEYSCDVQMQVIEEKDYYVCIKSFSGNNVFATRGYNTGSNLCGFSGKPIQTEVAAYQIFAQKRKFDNVGKIEIPPKTNLAEMAKEYLIKTYGPEITCPDGICIIPIKIRAKTAQEISVKELEIAYTSPGGYFPEKNLYDLQEIPPTITTESKNIYLDDAQFKVPNEFGDKTLTLKIDDQTILTKQIKIKEVPTIESIFPRNTMAGYPTKFIADVKKFGKNITQYEWDFGNGDTRITQIGEVTYTYNTTGLPNVKIKITDSDLRTNLKIFSVNVSSPKDAIEEQISSRIDTLTLIDVELNTYSEFKKNYLKEKINLKSLNEKIAGIQIAKANASTDSDYISIMNSIFKLEMPSAISKTKNGNSLEFFIDKEKINLENLKEIGSGDYSNEEQSKEQISSWNLEKMTTTISFEEISGDYPEGKREIATFFEIRTAPKTSLNYTYYIIIDKLENIKFSETFASLENQTYYLPITTGSKSINIATTSKIEFTELPLIITPGLSDISLGVNPNAKKLDKKSSKWIFFSLIVVFLIILGIAIYILLQVWYKKKYENYLFPNKNDLYNLITFVQNAKQNNKTEVQIRNDLRRSKWSGEQINFVIKKYYGKRTGMAEIKNPFSKNPRTTPQFDPKKKF